MKTNSFTTLSLVVFCFLFGNVALVAQWSGSSLNGDTYRNGNVGIGLSYPQAKLEVKHTGTLGGRFNPSKSYLTLSDGYHKLLMDNNEIYTNGHLVIGAGNNKWIDFRTVTTSGSSTRMQIAGNGNVGIGTTNPAYLLDVRKDQNARTRLSIRNYSTGSNQEASVMLISNGVAGVDILSYGTNASGTLSGFTKKKSVFLRTHAGSPADRLVISTGSSAPIHFAIKDQHKMSIHTNGNVGIGTTNPAYLLDVRKDQNARTRLSVRNYSTGSNQEASVMIISNGVAGFDILSYGTNASGTLSGFTKKKSVFLRTHAGSPADRLVIGTGSSAPIHFAIKDQPKMSIQTDGKIAIGNTTTPGNYKLYVEQGILTEQVKVALANSTDWADYVLAKDYDLPTLQEKATFIQENGHLPNFKSATAYYKAGGIELKDIAIKQQEVLEENTLHLIEHEEQLEELKMENGKLKAENEALKARLEAIEKHLGLK